MPHSYCDSNLLAVLVSCYEDLKTFLTRKYGCRSLAEEVVQETWLRVRQLSQPIVVDHPRAYLFKMAANLAIDHLRSEKVRKRYISEDSQADEFPKDTPLPDRVLDYKQRLAVLRQAVDELPPRCREVFLLHKFEEYSHAEIAERLDISRNMVEKHIIRGLAHCRNRLRQAMP
ncbi:ECF-type RNA polymerase sigma factor, sigma-70 family [Nitrospina gracilis 3/211]|uniref:ECF-type RNA polymerase sigma factor, sigma-70 family n=1 Tax=Nitrospina gracilis (strain 3/211) TaxID=1266370 RepID=M1YYD0_NITG3|nr:MULTISPECIES: sigma-70 family RNA polymerase sigma factor [Nitrospina]MCF8723598.1 RNA polymerase sigma-70 factor (ECF subfamily) [Nitrospina sp. Nb-3]CCQ90678.1 ECF-type RNA polymerase sigma factor, sigma-70 family [Nitrospina gracilis 3/211]